MRTRLKQTGPRGSLPIGGHRRSRLVGMEATLRAWLKETGDLTLAARCARLAAHGIAITGPAVWHPLDKGTLTRKKPLHASEHARADVHAARREGPAAQPALDIMKRVVLDETGASTNMARREGRAPRGERCVASVPHGHGHPPTCVAGLRHDDSTAPMVADGAMPGALFLQYVQTFLCPTRHPGDLVIADHVRRHNVAGVKAAVEAVGGTHPLSSAGFPRSESHRNTVGHTQGAAPQRRPTDRGRPLEGHRYAAGPLHTRGVHTLLRVLRLCKDIN